jgi:hypothetical protein
MYFKMKLLALPILLVAIAAPLGAQPTLPALSPHARIEQQVGFTEITIDYHRPSARGRKIFGALVPYGKVWKTGGGDCTKIKFSEAVVVEGNSVAQGTYSLYTIPGERQWTIILNRDTTGFYDQKNDILRFQVKPYTTTRVFHALSIDLDFIPEESALHVTWENTGIAFRIQTNTDEKLAKLVKQQLNSQSQKADFFALAAEYYLFRNDQLDQALVLVNRSLSLEPASWYYSLKVDILKKAGRYAEALEALNTAIGYDKKNPENWSKEQFDEVMDGHVATMKELKGKLEK